MTRKRTKTEFIATPFVRVRVFIEARSQLERAVNGGIITDGSLALSLQAGLAAGRRFMLRPAPRDW